MDVVHSIKTYIDSMINEAGPGLKALLMDKETIGIISIVYPQSEMLQKEVYLFEAVENFVPKQELLDFIKCLVFIRPTEKNLNYMIRELKHPRFGQYFIYFNNIISKTDIKMIADVDDGEAVKAIEEFYADYFAINPHTFSMNVKFCYQNITHWNPSSLQRCTSGLISVLLSLNRAPLIRYQSNSELSTQLAKQIVQMMAKESMLFDSTRVHSDTQPLLLILDRKFDPITPLLNQWTYQAMLHELLGITNNRVSLAHLPNISAELKDIVLSAEQDEFYQFNQYLNYGEICSNIKQLMEDFQAKTKNQKKIESIADMKSFIETYPQFKKLSGTVAKHVTLIDEISRLVNAHNLLGVSETEQELISNHDSSDSMKRIQQLITNPKIRDNDLLRLVMLYALTFYSSSNANIANLTRTLERRGMNPTETKVVQQIIDFCGLKNNRDSEMLGSEHVKAFTKKMIKGFRGVENIYTQHTPELKTILEDLLRGRLREVPYPFLGSVVQRERPSEVIVFIVGGITYEESLLVYNLNKTFPGVKIILGGSSVHNSQSFLAEVRQSFEYSLSSRGVDVI